MYGNETSATFSTLSPVSISGLQFSKNGRTILASYQGDQIYTFPVYGFPRREYQEINQEGTFLGKHSRSSPINLERNFKVKDENKIINNKEIILPPPSLITSKDDNIDILNNSFQQRCRSRSRSDSILTDDCIGAQAIFGGHINYATFLKSVSFFGPNDEYVVSGSDSGHLWIWDSSIGDNDSSDPYKRECKISILISIFYI